MVALRNLYARFVLFLIRPALKLHSKETQSQRECEIDETVFMKTVSSNSMISTGLESVYGLTRPGK